MARQQKKAPLGKRISRWLEAKVLFALLGLFRHMHPDRASATGGWIGRHLLQPLFRGRRIYETIAVVYPELDRAGADALIAGMSENLGRMMGEIDHFGFFMSAEGRSRFTFEGREHIEAAIARGRPILFATGHFGNFEMGLCALYHEGVRIAAVARKPNNVAVGDYLEQRREEAGLEKLFDKSPEGTRQLVSWLKSGGNAAMYVDQHLAEGIPAPMFGRDVLTTHTPATLALTHDFTLLAGGVRRVGDGTHFHAKCYPPIVPPRSGNDAQDILTMTAQMNAVMEAEVRARPEHWLWMHARFKPIERLSRRARRLLEEAGRDPGAYERGAAAPAETE